MDGRGHHTHRAHERKTARSGPVAKLTPPRLPAVVERRRLYRLLDDASSRPVVWVAAPPGAGKTTLLLSYLAARRRPCLWYQVDEADEDPAALFRYLSMAVRAGPGPRLPRLEPAHLAALPAFAARFFDALWARLTRRHALVFDNFQLLDADGPTCRLLCRAFEAVSPGRAVYVLSRSGPPANFTRLEANRAVARLDPDALRLTAVEAEAMARLRLGRMARSQTATLTTLNRLLEGWAGGLVLLLERGGEDLAGALEADTVDRARLFDYLAREVLAAMAPEEQALLVRMSLFPSATAAMARRVTGMTSVEPFLNRLYRTRYFTERRPGKPPSYQFHPLFREFLLSEVRQRLPATRRKALLGRVVRILEDEGRADEALVVLQQWGEILPRARLIRRQAPRWLAERRYRTLSAALDGLPREVVRSDPELLLWQARAAAPFDPGYAERIFREAWTVSQQRKAGSQAALAWSGVVDSIVAQAQDLRRLDRWIDRYLTVSAVRHRSQETKVAVLISLLSALLWRRPQDPRLRSLFEMVCVLLRAIAVAPVRIGLGFRLMPAVLAWGDMPAAWSLQAILLGSARRDELPPIARAELEASEAMVALHSGDGSRCLRCSDEAFRIIREEGLDYFYLFMAGSRIGGCLMRGDFVGADEALGRMPTPPPGSGVLGEFVLDNAAWIALRRGDRDMARVRVLEALGFSGKGGPMSHVHTQLMAAHVFEGLGEATVAWKHLGRADTMARRSRLTALELMAAFTKAHLHLGAGRRSAAVRALRQALALTRKGGMRYFIGWQPESMGRLLATALEERIEPTHTREFVTTMRPALRAPGPENLAWPWPVRIYTLGGFSIERAGETAARSRKAPRRAWSLLQSLVAMDGRDVPTHRLADALWPEADGDRAEQALATALHRLRRLLGGEGSVETRGGCVNLSRQLCWCDTWAFEGALQRSQIANRRGNAVEAARWKARACALYRGPFLPDVDQEWASALRERLHRQHERVRGGSSESVSHL